MRIPNRRLQRALIAAGHSPSLCAWFRSGDPATVDTIVALASGAAAVLGGYGVKGGSALTNLMHSNLDVRKDLPHHVAVAICEGRVEIWAGDSRRNLGPLLVTYGERKFKGSFHRYPGRVDLTLDDLENGRMVLTSSWSFTNRTGLIVARTVTAMSTVSEV